MAELDDGQQTGEGKGWMGRAFGKVIGMFSAGQTASKEGELNDEFLESEGGVRGLEKKRRREKYVRDGKRKGRGKKKRKEGRKRRKKK